MATTFEISSMAIKLQPKKLNNKVIGVFPYFHVQCYIIRAIITRYYNKLLVYSTYRDVSRSFLKERK